MTQTNTEIAGSARFFSSLLEDDKAETPMIRKLNLLAGLLSFQLSVLADVNSLLPEAAGLYHLQVLMVGYDLDGVLKIGTLEISAAPEYYFGHRYWDFRPSQTTMKSVHKNFQASLGGMHDVANGVLKNPAKLARYNAVSKFQTSLPVGGSSLTLSDLKALGSVLLKETAKAHREVGGPTQVATFHSGKIIGLEQPPDLPEIKKPMGMAVARGGHWSESTFYGTGIVMVYESVAFPKRSPIKLDGAIFLHCRITDSIVTFRGGVTFIDDSTTIKNSYPEFMDETSLQAQRLRNRFHWASEPP